MFKATLADPAMMRDSIDAISEIITEGIIKINKDGIFLMAADRAVVAVVSWHLKANAFKSYQCDQEHKIGVNLASLLRILRRAKASDILQLSLQDNFIITIKGESKRQFTVPLLDLREEEIPKIEELKFQASAKLRTSALEEGIADAELVSDCVALDLNPESIKLSASGNGSTSETLIKPKNIIAKEPVRSVYSLEYLRKMLKAGRLADQVTLRFGKDFPLKLEFERPGLSLVFVLAPRVEE